MPKNYWLMKSEPDVYSIDDLKRDKTTYWEGVRNFQARNFLRAMKCGDPVMVYHSVTEKQVVGLARVKHEAYHDPTAKEEDWVAVDLEVWQTLKEQVPLEKIKRDFLLKDIPLVRQARLSVMPLSAAAFRRILRLAKTSV